MPAYFNISLQFERNDIYDNFVEDFHKALDQADLKFKAGYWGFEKDSCESVIEWNQMKLEQNFQLGFTEHHSHDYKQVVFDYSDYSEVRGFWMNQYPEEGMFSYEIIIPEHDVLNCEYPIKFKEDKINELLMLAKQIWLFPYVKAIQTGLEGSDASIGLTELKMGSCPNIYPFAIVDGSDDFLINTEYCQEKITGVKRGKIVLDCTQITGINLE